MFFHYDSIFKFYGALFLALIFTLLCTQVKSQNYGNEWIDYDKRYYKFPISQEGIYRIDYTALATAGVPVSSIDPRNFQIFNRQQEVPIYVEGEADGVFNLSDFIELHAKGNDGWLDGLVYDNLDDQTNEHYSLFNDTIHYYLTWNSSIDNLRYEPESNQNLDGLTPLSYIWKTNLVNATSHYRYGPQDSFGSSYPQYVAGEGWFSGTVGFPGGTEGTQYTIALNSSSAYLGADAPFATIRTIAVGSSAAQGSPNHHLKIFFGSTNVASDAGMTELQDVTFSGYQVVENAFDVQATQLPGTTTFVRHRIINDLGLASDYISVAHASLHYPKLPVFSGTIGEAFGIPSDNSGQLALLEVNGLPSGSIVYALGNEPKRIIMSQQSGVSKAGIPQIGTETSCYLAIPSTIQNIEDLQAVGTGGFFTNYESLNPDSGYVIITHPILWQGAQIYETYRSQRFNTALINVEELYDQFGGGINKHGLSIRRFMDFAINKWDTPPQYLFLIGKSIREAREGGIAGSRQHVPYYEGNLVPSFGFPSSDHLITVGLTGNDLTPAVKTGRLCAKNNEEVIDYYNKMVTFESQVPAMWMKNLLHFGGGTTSAEQSQFQGYLEAFANTIADTCFGGISHPFYKDDSAPISITESQELTDLIEGGVSIMTFFGHAGGTGFDQSIDDPSNFNWNGKYPFLIGNACYTGDIFQPGANSTSEEYLLLAEHGVIGFLSTVKLGFSNTLNQYTGELYRQIAYKQYHGTVGHQIVNTIDIVQGITPDIIMTNQVLGMTLHGDPALIINSFAEPDFEVEVSSVFFNPAEVSAVVDSFDVHIALVNLGKATNQDFDVFVERKFPDNGADSVYVIHVDRLINIDTLTLTLPVQANRALGINLFDVDVDLPFNVVSELEDFGNNSVSNVPLVITNGGILPVYPYKFAVVGQNDVTIKASTGNPFAEATNYRFQVDTISTFDSPFLSQIVIEQAGGLIEWPLAFTCVDSTVYFWRVRVDEGDEATMQWRNSSFQYIEGKTGWGQAHFDQFAENNYNNIQYNFEDRKFEFNTGDVNLRCDVRGGFTTYDTQYAINLDLIEYAGCGSNPALHVAVIDPITFEAWGTSYEEENPDNNFGNYNNGSLCRDRVEYTFFYFQTDVFTEPLSDLVLNEVPDGHYILIYSWIYLVKSVLHEASPFYSTIQELGGSLDYQTMQDSIPYIFFVKKGDLSTVNEVIGQNKLDELQLNIMLSASSDQGAMSAVMAGPSNDWQSMHWRFNSLESPSEDSTQVSLGGKLWNGNNISLPQTSFFQQSMDYPDLSNLVNASNVPLVNFKAYLKDEGNQTPAQLRRWHLLFDEVPEAVVNPAATFSFDSPELDQGEEISLKYAITNASTKDMDSLLVKSWVVNAQNVESSVSYRRISPLPAGQTIIDSLTVDTWGFAGLNQLWVEVNPQNPQSSDPNLFDQLEQFHFNNYLQLAVDVDSDKINPLLDVTFDGLHILDGEVVSANPEISISLTDENLFLMLDADADTSNFEVFVSPPQGEFKRIHFYSVGVEQMRWIPATGSTNRFQILYNPSFPEDGVYKILVRGKDRSGNSSGDKDYQISFEVINQSTITDVLNYPNPFSTKTHFVFTLTGSQVPDYMKIQIMTISGKIVKEITNAELGTIRVGRNVTDYYWDGTDMYGDRLANGVYLYRVIAKINGQTIDKRETAAGKYFKQEFGKMYLMR